MTITPFVFPQQGSGLLMSDDDTAFHGEFSDDWVVNGKVITHLRFVCWSVLHLNM